MILLALLVPALMLALLFAMDALENLLFPRPTATHDVTVATDASSRDNQQEVIQPPATQLQVGLVPGPSTTEADIVRDGLTWASVGVEGVAPRRRPTSP
ncbi:hypothetical protein QF037_000487 [Streptomyces canus]|uniref:hypothetical protein n=1 Tax=Streptomyces canus TaxID=58343 RepID=UPI002787EB18|nr:hypothetical protein [Streptomyces canus]MDQ0596142.1 hypothetical protein [Streptomyces canus]